MVPSALVPLETLRLTSSGKIDRKALPKADRQHIEINEDFMAPRDALEQVLLHLWSKVLRIKRIGIQDNFFELGGTLFWRCA
jgi:hypothetical protein